MKNNQLKKILSVLLAVVMLMTTCAIGGLTSLKTLYLPTTLTSMVSGAFYTSSTTSLIVYYAGTAAQYSANVDDSLVNSKYDETWFTGASFVYNHSCSGSVIEVLEESTCSAYGSGVYSCSTCNRTYIADLTELGVHTYSATADDVEATIPICTHGTGYTYTCTVCQEATVIYGDDIDPTNHSGTQRKYIDENGDIQTYWSCCSSTSYITDLADLMLEYSDEVEYFAGLTLVPSNSLTASGSYTASYTIDDYDTYLKLIELAQLVMSATLEVIELSDGGYATSIYGTGECEFEGWNTYKMREYFIDMYTELLSEMDGGNEITAYVSSFFTNFICGANSGNYTPTKSHHIFYST